MKRIRCSSIVLLCLIVIATTHIQAPLADEMCGTAAGGARFHKCDLPIHIYYDPSGAPGSCTAAVVQQAIEIWNDAYPYQDLLYYAGTTSIHDIICDHTGSPCDGPGANKLNQLIWISGGTLGRMCWCLTPGTFDFEKDTRINSAVHVCDAPGPTEYAAITTILHELGHVLGLGHDHATCTGSIMVPGGLPGMVQDTLAQCDIDHINDIYDPMAIADDSLEITNVNVNTSFHPSTYTWDAVFTFDTDPSATVSVFYDPSMVCYPPCAYSQVETGQDETSHTITLTGLAPATTYCYKITAQSASSETGCLPEVLGSFPLDNTYDEIYSISATHIELSCRLRISWKTKFPSENNMLYWRKLGDDDWNEKSPSQPDCDEDRYYSASFGVSPVTYYEYKISTKIDNVTYNTGVMQKRSGRCDEDPPIPKWTSPQDIAKAFIHAYPNPFNPQTTLTFNVPSPGDIQLTIYSAEGSFIRTLASGYYNKGIHRVDWDSTNHVGERVSSGIYFARLIIGEEVVTSKVTLMR